MTSSININSRPPKLGRRRFLKVSGTAALLHAGNRGTVSSAVEVGAPSVHRNRKLKLRVLGTHVTLQEKIRLKAEQDLGLEIEFTPGGSAEVLHKASTQPESFDLYEQWSNSLRVLWQAGSITPIDIDRIKHWGEVNQLTKSGRLIPDAKIGRGDAPHRLLYVQPDGSVSEQESSQISFLPYVHNVDSFGYDADIVRYQDRQQSWAWLLDPRWRGRVAIVNAPAIGLFDLALAAQANGDLTFDDIGELSEKDLDRLFDRMIDLKTGGHFRGIWNSVPDSVRLMQRKEAVIESMFSPAVYSLRQSGTNCVYAAPKEGYRAWHGVMCMSSAISDESREAAYRFMNWWLSGWPGAFIARQGYYISNPSRARQFMSPEEWDYWYGGLPAARDLLGTSGEVVVRAGHVRNGGDYEARFSNVAVWNTVMDSYEYSLLRWNEFLSS
ncbi:ABC transporter substrate-binding protein [Roseiconus lacunae]|uniref:ABC transporter substrate-binding protein n=1 Tax=Roseiconus lacunae TaxID=2605694 RepID=UPI0011F13CFE|nr:extracellular solute-binding protein [Roseiconus lacunae]MCD0463636.1 extracellular solute-binding protein [Roseiconus lacunae]